MPNLTRMAKEILNIEKDFLFRVDNPRNTPDAFDLYVFEQAWPSTSLGFKGIGGHTMVTETTYVFVSPLEENCIVYFAGRFAYKVPHSKVFMDDIAKQHMEPVYRAEKYIKAAREQYDGSGT